MTPTSIMNLASLNAQWLSNRQQVLAQNIANVNTPGYKSRDLVPFNDVLQSILSAGSSSGTAFDDPVSLSKASQSQLNEVNLSGNDVSIDDELMKLGETTSQYSLNTNIIKSFHRMLISSLKG